jgi:hypothetical protein
LVVLLVGGGASRARAQEKRWEVEVYGGAVAARSASEGRQTLPPPGSPIVTSSPLAPSREVPSWFFGDGAALLNAANEDVGGAAKLAPLDPLFARAKGGRTAVAGARLRRRLSDHNMLEISADFLGSSRIAPVDLSSTIEAARRSFAETFTELLRSGPFTSIVVDATAQTSDPARRDVALTAAFNSDVGPVGPLIAYLTFGGGIVTATGGRPSAELNGRYRAFVLAQVPIEERDRVTIQLERPLAFTSVVGGGLRRDVAARWSVRFDVRALIGPDATRMTISASPSAEHGAPAGSVELLTNPAIVFSNDPSIGRRSTLSAAPLENVKVFDGGIRSRTVVTVGISRRF